MVLMIRIENLLAVAKHLLQICVSQELHSRWESIFERNNSFKSSYRGRLSKFSLLYGSLAVLIQIAQNVPQLIVKGSAKAVNIWRGIEWIFNVSFLFEKWVHECRLEREHTCYRISKTIHLLLGRNYCGKIWKQKIKMVDQKENLICIAYRLENTRPVSIRRRIVVSGALMTTWLAMILIACGTTT